MNVLDFFFLPHHSWRPAPVAQTVPPWPSQTLSSQYLQDHKDSLPAPCAYLYKDMFIMKILQKCYKNRKSYMYFWLEKGFLWENTTYKVLKILIWL